MLLFSIYDANLEMDEKRHQTERSSRTTSRRLINHLPNLNMNCTLWLEDAGGGGGGLPVS